MAVCPMRCTWIQATALAALCAFAGGVLAATPTVKACGHHDYPPWNWAQGGQIVGACADLAKRAIERLGYHVDMSYVGPWKRCQNLVETGEVDVNICAFRNAARDAAYVIVEPRMAQNNIAVFVREDKRDLLHFSGWSDLQGLRTGLITGVSMGSEFDSFLQEHTTIERAPNLLSVWKMLELGRIDIAPFGLEAGLLAIERHGLQGRIVPLPQAALLGDLHVIVSKKSPLAARAHEIGSYFERAGYRDELRRALDESGQLYLRSVAPVH